jgi:hypothetical protein
MSPTAAGSCARNGADEPRTPSVLYHYTDALGLLGILDRCGLWATDVAFLNDREELAYGKDAVIQELRRRAEEIDPGGVAGVNDADGSRAMIAHSTASELERMFNAGTDLHQRVYVSCFCDHPDLLSQWRAYGRGRGYAIGFHTDRLPVGSGDPGEVQLVQVRYGLDHVDRWLRDLSAAVTEHPSGHPGSKGYFEYVHTVLPATASIKHPTFSEEREWRLIAVGYGADESIRFRASEYGPVPYRTLEFGAPAIVSVHVGPGPEMALRANGARLLLQHTGFTDAEVVESTSTLRG